MTPDEAAALVPLASELVGSVRDFGPEIVADVLARVPDGRHDALAVVLAAMVDPDARPGQLLAWTELGPVTSRTFEPPTLRPDRAEKVCPDCGDLVRIGHLARHRQRADHQLAGCLPTSVATDRLGIGHTTNRKGQPDRTRLAPDRPIRRNRKEGPW